MSYPLHNNIVVSQLIGIEFSGNVVPLSWFNALRVDYKGTTKPDMNAILLLSDIVYWYRPVEIRDERTGQHKEYQKKFKGDHLQKSYSALCGLYGMTRQQVYDALRRLQEQHGLIKRIVKVVESEAGRKIGNSLHIDLNVPRLLEITFSEEHLTAHRQAPSLPTDSKPSCLQTVTYTENTGTQTTEELKDSLAPKARKSKEPKVITISNSQEVFDAIVRYVFRIDPTDRVALNGNGARVGQIRKALAKLELDLSPAEMANLIKNFIEWYYTKYPNSRPLRNPDSVTSHLADYLNEIKKTSNKGGSRWDSSVEERMKQSQR